MSRPTDEYEELREPEHDDILCRSNNRAVSSEWFTRLQIREHEIVVGELMDLGCWWGTLQNAWTHINGYPVRTQNKRHSRMEDDHTHRLSLPKRVNTNRFGDDNWIS